MINEVYVCGTCGKQHEGLPFAYGSPAPAYWERVGVRPHIVLEPTDHPLAVEQRTGITVARVREIAALLLHPQG